MATGTKGRRLVDAVDDVVRELRTANALAASALEHDTKGEASATPATAARAVRRNALRAVAREGLDLEGADRG